MAKPVITLPPNGDLEPAVVDQPYAAALRATNGEARITWSVAHNPDWLNLSDLGALTGTPHQPGDFTFLVRATSDGGFDEQQLHLRVNKRNVWSFVWGVVCLLVLGVAYAAPRLFAPGWTFPAWSAPLFAVVATFAIALLVAGWAWYSLSPGDSSAIQSKAPWTALRLIFAKLVEGKDGRASTSKLQMFLWFGMGLFAYLTAFFTRWLVQALPPGPIDVPTNLIYAMGIGVGTGVLAKGITTYQVDQGRITKPSVKTPDSSGKPTSDPGSAAVVQDDTNSLDLAKVQMLAWTVVALGIYLYSLLQAVTDALPSTAAMALPDIGQGLVVLMGLGHGAYLGQKLISTSAPHIASINPHSGPPKSAVTLKGTGFGDNQGTSQIWIDGQDQQISATQWSSDTMVFNLPARAPNGSDWGNGRPLQLSVVVDGQESERLTFTIALPVLTKLRKDSGWANDQIVVIGSNFGPKGTLTLTANDVVVTGDNIVRWEDDLIAFTLPGGSQKFPAGQPATIRFSGYPGELSYTVN